MNRRIKLAAALLTAAALLAGCDGGEPAATSGNTSVTTTQSPALSSAGTSLTGEPAAENWDMEAAWPLLGVPEWAGAEQITADYYPDRNDEADTCILFVDASEETYHAWLGEMEAASFTGYRFDGESSLWRAGRYRILSEPGRSALPGHYEIDARLVDGAQALPAAFANAFPAWNGDGAFDCYEDPGQSGENVSALMGVSVAESDAGIQRYFEALIAAGFEPAEETTPHYGQYCSRYVKRDGAATYTFEAGELWERKNDAGQGTAVCTFFIQNGGQK